MTVRVTRTTTRTVDLPADLGVTVAEDYASDDYAVFAPVLAVETATEVVAGIVASYVVRLVGPDDQGRIRGQCRTYRRDYFEDSTTDIPEVLRPFLVGPDVLRGELPVAGEEVTK